MRNGQSSETVQSSTMDSLGPVSRKHQDWFDGKASGSDAIPAEIYKGGPTVAEKLTEFFHSMWRKEAIPQGCNIIHLFKQKGNPQVCDNYLGISLLSVAGKNPTEPIE